MSVGGSDSSSPVFLAHCAGRLCRRLLGFDSLIVFFPIFGDWHRNSGLERLGLKTAEIAFSSRAVARAAKELEAGATTARVATKSDAEELFLRLYQGAGYRNTTGISGAETRNLFGSKAYTYHWDTAAGHGPLNPHGTGPHLQIHPPQGSTIRIFYGPQE